MKKRTAVECVQALADFIRDEERSTEEVEEALRADGKDPKQIVADLRQKIAELITKAEAED